MRNHKKNVVLVLLAASLGGCAVLEPGGMQVLEVDHVMADTVSASRAPTGEQKTVLARAQEEFAKDPSPLNRVRLAALLATLPAPLRDDTRAAQLLEPIADPASPGAGRFAAVLAIHIAERQQLARESERLHKDAERQQKDAERIARERERAEKERERVEKERERADKERERLDRERDKREETLKQQLEALRSIERGILEREERLRKKPR